MSLSVQTVAATHAPTTVYSARILEYLPLGSQVCDATTYNGRTIEDVMTVVCGPVSESCLTRESLRPE
jgi:hypothetical protein